MSWWLNNIDKDKLVSKANKADILSWQNSLSQDKYLQKIFKSNVEKHIGADLFNVLWRINPQLKDTNTPGINKALKRWIEIFIQSEGYNKLHDKTISNRELSSIATTQLYKQFINYKEQQKSANISKSPLNELETIRNIAEANEAAQKQANLESVKINNQLQEAIGSGMQDGSQTQVKLDTYINRVVNKLDSKIDSLTKIIELVGGDGSGDSSSNDTNQILIDLLQTDQIIDKLDTDLINKITRIAGRMQAIIDNVKKTSLQHSVVPLEITFGNDLGKLVSSEYGLLSDEETENIFWHKYQEQSLLQYETKNKMAEGKGPIVFCCDYSGSMYSNDKLTNALALLVIISKQAFQEKRQITLIPFAWYAEEIVITNMKDLLNAIQAQYNLGYDTNFVPPLDKTIEIISKEKTMLKADLIFITDGIASLNDTYIENFITKKQELNFKAFGISIKTRFMLAQRELFDGIAHMNPADNSLAWFTDFVAYNEQ